MNNSTELDLSSVDQRRSYRPGEKLSLSLLWALPSVPDSLEVRLFWFTRGKGTEEIGVVAVEKIPSPEAAGERAVTFILPQAPYSFSGKLITLTWAVELVAEPGGKCAHWEFTMSPSGEEILLNRPDHAARV
jgi:hypothetical protein